MVCLGLQAAPASRTWANENGLSILSIDLFAGVRPRLKKLAPGGIWNGAPLRVCTPKALEKEISPQLDLIARLLGSPLRLIRPGKKCAFLIRAITSPPSVNDQPHQYVLQVRVSHCTLQGCRLRHVILDTATAPLSDQKAIQLVYDYLVDGGLLAQARQRGMTRP